MKPALNLLIASWVFFGSLELGKVEVILASGAKPRVVIVRQADTTAPEQTVVRELADNLQKITGAMSQVLDSRAAEVRDRAIIVGSGQAAHTNFALTLVRRTGVLRALPRRSPTTDAKRAERFSSSSTRNERKEYQHRHRRFGVWGEIHSTLA